MKALRRSNTTSTPSSSSSSPSWSWIQLRSILIVSSSPVVDRGSLKSPWSRRRRKRILSRQQWNSLFLPDGRLRDGGVKFLRRARSGGIDPSIRAEVWPFLLGVYDLNSTAAERGNIKSQKRVEYEILRRRCRRLLSLWYKLNHVGHISENGSYSFKEVPESVVSGNFSMRSSLAIDEESGIEDPPLLVRSPGRYTFGAKEVSGSDDQPVFDRTPNSSSHMMDESSNEDQAVYDETPHSFAHSVDEDRFEITHLDASEVETEYSESESSADEDEEGLQIPTITEGNMGHDPKYSKLASFKVDFSIRKAEDFATWQRIIRLDAVRANAESVTYSPNQAKISEENANQSALAVGLKDYDHLEPCMIYHAARVVAVLEAYALYDLEIGYCQGMSDLLSPIIAVIEDDHEAFWCFVGFMRKARHNFRLDEVGIQRQLSIVAKIIKSKDLRFYRHLEKLQAEDCFFVYRMVVVMFRRELSFEQTVCLWEVMWAEQAAIRAGIGKSGWGRIRPRAPPTDNLLLFAIAACVLQRRKLIIDKYRTMDEILRECNNMTGRLDVWRLLDDAHDLVVALHDRI